MSIFLNELQSIHERCLKDISFKTDVNSSRANQYPEYKEAATLCKFIMDYEDKYSLFVRPQDYGRFYESAVDFDMLCNGIYHSIVDDGDIAYVQATEECPRIIFKNRWEITIEDALTESQKECFETINAFKTKYNQPLIQQKLVFYNNAYEFIEAVNNYDRFVLQRRDKVDNFLKNLRAVPSNPA